MHAVGDPTPLRRRPITRTVRLALTVGALLLLGGVSLLPNAPVGRAQRQAAVETVSIRADGDRGPVRLRHGFLHGLDGTATYDAAKVAALRPRHWRLGKYQSYAFVKELADTEITYGLSGPYAWSRGGFPAVSPWEDWDEYEEYVRTRVTQILATFPDRPPAFWDIWNEGDHSYFWHGTNEQLLELFARTARVVREVDPDAKLVGPSVSWYRRGHPGVADIVAFLADLDAQYSVRVDAVSWHENHTHTPDVIVINTRNIRNDLLERFGSDYTPELHVNEHMGTEVHSAPGWNVGYLYYFEQADVDAWMRACWNVYDTENPDGSATRWNDCWAGLNGMFMYDGVTEQPAYWVLLAYAETEDETRLPVELSTHTTTALASRDDSQLRTRVLVGRHGGSSVADVNVRLTSWPWPGDVVATVSRIPTIEGFRSNPSRAVPLPDGPVPEFSRHLEVGADREVVVTLPDVAEGEAWLIDVTPAPRLWLPRVVATPD